MLNAIVDGVKKSIKDARRGEIGYDPWNPTIRVKACMGNYLAYWRYIDPRPTLPEGYENETEWHEAWKRGVSAEYVEVICGINQEHRADIKTPECVIEVQRSPISIEVAQERSRFYAPLTKSGRIIWIFNAYNACAKRHLNFGSIDKRGVFKIEWKWIKVHIADVSRLTITDVYLDISPKCESLIRIWKHDGEIYGKWMRKATFFDKYLKPYSDIDCNEFLKGLNEIKASDYIS